MRIELVVFDMAGTTVYDGDAVNTCLRAALDAAGCAVSRDMVKQVMGIPKPVAIQWLMERHYGKRPLIRHRLGWLRSPSIDASVSSDEVPRGRPYPDLVRRAMDLTGVTDAARVAKVGDTPADLEEGRAAGCGLVVGVTSGSHTRADLEPFPHTHLIRSIAGLPALLRSLR